MVASIHHSMAIVLAAGQGARFGGDKLLATLSDGRSVIEHTLESVAKTFDVYTCVVRENDRSLQDLLDQLGHPWIVAASAEEGLSQTIRAGISQYPHVGGWLFVLGDMPTVESATLKQLKQNLENGSGQIIVAPHKNSKIGNPIGFSRHFFEQLLSLEGDAGARRLLEKYSETLIEVPVEDAGIFYDVDTPQDLSNL